MKRYLLFIAFFAFSMSTASAQFDAGKLFGGANLGYASPIGDFSEYAKGGFAYNLLAGYQFTEKLSAGIEYSSAVTVALDVEGGSGFLGFTAYGLNAFVVKGWYKFMTGNFKPYVGLGVGLANVAEPTIIINNVETEGASRLGLGANAELGLTIAGFNVSYSFNINGKTPSAEESVLNIESADLSVSYHRFALGYIYNF